MINVTDFAIGYFSLLGSWIAIGLWLYAIIHDYKYDVEYWVFDAWCINILLPFVGIARGIILSLE